MNVKYTFPTPPGPDIIKGLNFVLSLSILK